MSKSPSVLLYRGQG